MQRVELAERLVVAGDNERESLFRDNSEFADVQLAYILKDICLDGWSSEPARSLAAASTLRLLTVRNPSRETFALSAWAAGLEALVRGQMERALSELDEAYYRFSELNNEHTAAATQVSKLIALAMLGRYDEAIDSGLRAREIFLKHGDILATGKVENNIGNTYFRRDDYKQAERFQTAARQRFTLLNHQIQLAKINNCLANTHAILHKFNSAQELYGEAVRQAEASGLTATQAEIEGNIGNFALLKGRYDQALDYLERARRHYTLIGMPHQSAIAELDIAEAYLELNLAPEAEEIYRRVIPKFSEFKMRAEQARALAHYGRALASVGSITEAEAALDHAGALYAAEKNAVGAAMILLWQAQLHHSQKNYRLAGQMASQAQTVLAASENWQRFLLARWLEGDSERVNGNSFRAQRILETTLDDGIAKQQPQIVERALTSLGLLASESGDNIKAEDYFRKAIAVTEALRAPLPAEEFLTAFLAGRLVAYKELVRLCLSAEPPRVKEALRFVESAKSRSLVDMISGKVDLRVDAPDEFESQLLAQIEGLRQELNYFYGRINRAGLNDDAVPSKMDGLQYGLRQRENEILEATRRLHHRANASIEQSFSVDLEQLQAQLKSDVALIEYTTINDELIAFVVSKDSIHLVRNLAAEDQVLAEIAQFRFQIDTFRHGSAIVRRHLDELAGRARKHLMSLYDILLRPLESMIRHPHLVVIPHAALHYLPFHALHDGTKYVIEDRQISYAPSAVILQQCLAPPVRQLERAVLVGATDHQTPHVRKEIESIAKVFPSALTFVDENATLNALRENASAADVIHFACHAHFRSDNPLFSAIRLADGWLTVRDAYGLRIDSSLVTVSACETGQSAVSPGEELIGLARGFLAAGAPSVLLTLWSVDDEGTAEFMTEFYRELRDTRSPANALRNAQLKVLKERSHPFFWSPFILVGRS